MKYPREHYCRTNENQLNMYIYWNINPTPMTMGHASCYDLRYTANIELNQ